MSDMDECTITVETVKGPVKGICLLSTLGDTFYRFRGVPFAKPPIGDLRFKDPQPIDAWTDVFDATIPGPSAMGFTGRLNIMNERCSENCLTLNVYTKNLTPKQLSPVMIWIHGGGFKYGNTAEELFGPDYLLQKNIVFVSINYRLGALGFLSIPDPSLNIPGNAGLKDQAMAFRWVRENIHAFGGDNKNITIFGSSAGATSVHCHLLSDFSKGLFDKAIMQSGSAFSEWGYSFPSNWAERLAKHLGWNGEGGTIGYYEFLKNVDGKKIVLEQERVTTDEEYKCWVFSPFSPTIEPYEAEQSFFTEEPAELAKTAWGNRIPLVIGCTSEEGLLFYEQLNDNPSRYNQEDSFECLFSIRFGKGSEKTKRYAEETKRFYYGDEQPEVGNMSKFLSILGDKYYVYATYLAVQFRANDPKSANTYLYRFNFESKANFTSSKSMFATPDSPGVCHTEELEYIFRSIFSKPVVEDSLEHITIDCLTTAWTKFAAEGNPDDPILTVFWIPVLKGSHQPYFCLNIAKEISFLPFPDYKRCELWKSFV